MKKQAGIEPACFFPVPYGEVGSAQIVPLCRSEMTASRTHGSPNFQPRPEGPGQKIGSPMRRLRRSRAAILDPAIPSRRWSPSFTNVKETTMTYALEIQVEELRAEMRAVVDAAERRQIKAELELAQAELAAALAEQDGSHSSEPPF